MAVVVVFCFLSVLLVSATVVNAEPECSPFHYHEQTLEKMIDVKYKMDILWDKMAKWEKEISAKLSMLEEISSQHGQFSAKLDDWVQDKISYINDTFAEFSKSHNNMSEIIKGSLKTPAVLFKVRSVDNRSPSVGETVTFQKIVQDEGQGYDNDTGVYTVPISGTYLFTVQFCLQHSKELAINIVANQSVITAANFGDDNWDGLCTSTNGFANVKKGDEVKVLVTHRYSGVVIFDDSDDRYWSYFSGALLHI